jgi:hypothetical protein
MAAGTAAPAGFEKQLIGAPPRLSTERIEHQLAVDGRIWASPVPSDERKCAKMHTIFKLSAEKAKTADWVAERAGYELPMSRESGADQNAPVVPVSAMRMQRTISFCVRHKYRRQLAFSVAPVSGGLS